MIGLANHGPSLKDTTEHLAHFLSGQGYATALAGVQHETHGDRKEMGYARMLDDEMEVDPAIDWDVASGHRADRFFGEARDRPFFLSVGFMQTHRLGRFHSVGSPPDGDPRYVRPPAPLPDTPETRQDYADYAVAAEQMDASMGNVLDALERHGLAANTLVILTTDHGIAFPMMKGQLSDHGTGVMLLLRGPGPGGRRFEGGGVVDAIVSHLDLFPTICDTLGLDPPERLRGKSLRPLLDGSAERLHERLFSETNYHASYEPARAVRTERYKYIRRIAPRSHPILPNCDDSPSKDRLLAEGWQDRPQPPEALHDLVFDPNEAANLAGDPAYAAILADCRERLEAWMQETHDPALAGEVPPAPGANAVPRDGRSPGEVWEPITETPD